MGGLTGVGDKLICNDYSSEEPSEKPVGSQNPSTPTYVVVTRAVRDSALFAGHARLPLAGEACFQDEAG